MKRWIALWLSGVLLCLTACADTTQAPSPSLSTTTSQTTFTTVPIILPTLPPTEETPTGPADEQTPDYVKTALTRYRHTGETVDMMRNQWAYKFLVTQELIDALQIEQWHLSGLPYDQHEDLERTSRADDPNAQSYDDIHIYLGYPAGKDYQIVLRISATYVAIGVVRPIQTPTEGGGYTSTAKTEYICYTVPQEQDGDVYKAAYEVIKENTTWFAA